MMSFMALDVLRRIFACKTLQLHYVSDTVQLLAGISQCNGKELEEAEDFKCVNVVY